MTSSPAASGAAPLRTAAQPVICEHHEDNDDPDEAWRPVGEQLEGTEQYVDKPHRAAGGAFSRAAGHLVDDSGPLFDSCTGFMLTSWVFVTARHCVSERVSIGDQASVEFGRFEDSFSDFATAELGYPREAAGDVHALIRAAELGSASGDVAGDVSSLMGATGSLRQFKCGFLAFDTDNRDIAYFGCTPNSFVTDSGLVQVAPGDVWGEYEIDRDEPAENWDTATVSYNDPSWANKRRTMLYSYSGEIFDEDGSCSGEHGGRCFWHTSDLMAGSSGGPTIRRFYQTVIGVNSFQFRGLTFEQADSFDPVDCGEFTGNGSTVFGSLGRAFDTLDPSMTCYGCDIRPPLPLDVQAAAPAERQIGQGAPESTMLNCDGNKFLSGIMGSSELGKIIGGRSIVGNLSGICERFGAEPKGRHLLDDATVLVAKSLQSGAEDPARDFARYYSRYRNWALSPDMKLIDTPEVIREKIVTPVGMPPTQSEVFCPAGYFMTAVRAYESKSYGAPVLGAIESIWCSKWSNPAESIKVEPFRPIGTDRDGDLAETRCAAGEAAIGAEFGLSGPYWPDGTFEPLRVTSLRLTCAPFRGVH